MERSRTPLVSPEAEPLRGLIFSLDEKLEVHCQKDTAMFGAPRQFAHHVPAGIAPPGYSYWRAVELTLPAPWYIVGFKEQADDDWVYRDLLVAWTSDLLAVTPSNERTVTVSVQLMRPGREPAEAPWTPVRISKIWKATEGTKGGRSVAVFEDAAGQRFCDSMDRVEMDSLTGFQLAWEEEAASRSDAKKGAKI